MSFELIVDNKAAVNLPIPPIEIVRTKMITLGADVRDLGAAIANELEAAGFSKEPAEMPLAVYDATKKAVTVYPNIVLPRLDIVTGTVSEKYCDLFSIKFYSAIATDIFARKWNDPETALNKHETTTMARHLTRILPKGTAADLIRDMAQKLEDYFLPPDLIYAETEADYVEMYSCNCSSCVKIGAYGYVDKVVGPHAEKLGLWPSIWYKYAPQIQGVYIKKGKTVVARAFLFKNNSADPKWSGHSQSYGSTLAFQTTLNKMLDKLCPAGGVNLREKFTAPVHTINGEKYALCFKCDNEINESLRMCYDRVNDVMMYGRQEDMPANCTNIGSYGYNKGFIPVSKVLQYDGVSNKKAA